MPDDLGSISALVLPSSPGLNCDAKVTQITCTAGVYFTGRRGDQLIEIAAHVLKKSPGLAIAPHCHEAYALGRG